MSELRALTQSEFSRVEARLRNPPPGSRSAAARESGVDLTLLIEQLRLTPAERVVRMHELAQVAESVRGAVRRHRQ